MSAAMTPSEIRGIRKALGLSAAKFAERLGFSGENRHVTVHRWEVGMRAPSDQTVILMRQLVRRSRKKVAQKRNDVATI